ncbi:EGF domain-containing protein [Corallococcus sp. H22C18031201]|nr:EGF domain-containing protein [Corallococcus sp. H22C18031201]
MGRHRRMASGRVLAPLLAGLLSVACGEPPVSEAVLAARPAPLGRASEGVKLGGDLYADAVAPGTTATVLNANNAVGAPDGEAATVLGLLNASLLLDMGAGEEGTGNLKVYYQGVALSVATQVDFLRADGTVLTTGALRLVNVSVGTHIAMVPFRGGSASYRYVRLRGSVIELYMVDAIEAEGRVVCGDAQTNGVETCDDGNIQSGDGCNSICQVEHGYTCHGQPSVCTDVDECYQGTAQCAPGELCVNTPGGYTCQPDCLAPRTVCGGACVDTRTDVLHCGACGQACAYGGSCALGVCVGGGALQFTATWNRDGDADLLVRTPTGKLISFWNPGPSDTTDRGILDVDARKGLGPENIYWPLGTTPPSGTYDICLSLTTFTPDVDVSAPVQAHVVVRRPGQLERVFDTPRIQPSLNFECAPSEANYVGSITYP